MSNTSRGGMSEPFKNEQMQALIGKVKLFFEDPNITARAGGQEIVTEFLDKLRENEIMRGFLSNLIRRHEQLVPAWVEEMHKNAWSNQALFKALGAAKDKVYKMTESVQALEQVRFGESSYQFKKLDASVLDSEPRLR
jgi:hypothetical protein